MLAFLLTDRQSSGWWRCGIEWIRGASLSASPRLTTSNFCAFDMDDHGDEKDDEAGGVESFTGPYSVIPTKPSTSLLKCCCW